ncbi:golgi nucleoside diphosphatase [Vairimorpha apis BRL 01]|uniref:Golgi nucleoside diphosphatase n=1 Tax=Vairimorpha apis BRL 01 TaxID=1037528 RepID=T0MDJ7_9MICR|nr:golgi nucleoside diphosphatase [Vairimorpha apis BRL 01]
MRLVQLFLIGIIDIGSTGSRLNIYGYTKAKDLVLYKQHKVEEGLHLLKNEQIRSKLKILSSFLDKYKKSKYFYEIKTSKIYSISTKKIENNFKIGIFCTAGFRSINKKNRIDKLRVIYDVFKKYNVKEYGILSGKYEGYLGFESLKYLLKKNNFIFIDMGGKSTQVVSNNSYISYKKGSTNINKNIFNIKKVDKTLPVYVSSVFTRKMKKFKVNEIKNAGMKRFLIQLGLKENKELIAVSKMDGVGINWSLGMSLRFL